MIKMLFLLSLNFIRIAFNKIFHPGQWNVAWFQRISPFCSLKVFKNGVLIIKKNTEFAAYCDFEVHDNGTLEIGERTYFNRYCMISAHEHVKIGNRCMFGPGVKIFDNNHKHTIKNGVSCKLNTAPVTIQDNCWIGSNVIILKGSNIGKNCVIGAGCIIHGNIPEGSVVKCKQELSIK